MLVSSVMICSCQKKDSAAEEQLTQPKTELGGREEKLAERLNSLEEKVNRLDQSVKELAEKQNAPINAQTNLTDVQNRPSDPPQVQAENEKMIQQFSAMISHASQVRAGDPARQERPGQRQLGPEDLQRQWQDKTKMSGKAVFPAAEATAPSPSPTPE